MMRDSEAAQQELSGLRVLIVHDWLVAWGGAERCVEEMLAMFPTADFIVGVRSRAMRDFNHVTRRARETWLQYVPGAREHHRWFLPLQGAAFASLDTNRYDLIVSSSHAFAKMVRRKPYATHVSYCHSPPRYLWDLSAAYRRDARALQRLALTAATGILQRIDRRSARGVDHFICNSGYIADRIRRCYGRHADVVYPPVAAKPCSGPVRSRENFLLSLGRLVPYKRVDLAIQAAERLGVRLVVAGDGPDRDRLEALAGPHTEFRGLVSEEEAASLLSRCAAFVFCAEEDFGITPVEANAHGAPVVAFGRGGVLETMRPGITAEFFYEQTEGAVVDAIQRTLLRRWCIGELQMNAERFSPATFRRNLMRSISTALNGPCSSKMAIATSC